MAPFYYQRTPNDCGPAAISAVTGIRYDEVLKDWPGGWLDSDRGNFGVPNDTPYDHGMFLESKKIPYRYVSFSEIVSDKCIGNKTIILLHLQSSKIKSSLLQYIKDYFYPVFNKHWVVLHSVSVARNTISLHWGNGEIKTYTLEHFKKLFKGAWPMCAYIIGQGNSKQSFFTKLFAKLTGRYF